MNFLEYEEAARRTASKTVHIGTMSLNDSILFRASCGIAGEGGELLDHFKKAVFQGHPINHQEVAKELGDVLWYIALACEGLGITMETLASMNLTKLYGRYPSGHFTTEDSINREGE